jgi:hypothetical protein
VGRRHIEIGMRNVGRERGAGDANRQRVLDPGFDGSLLKG